MRGKKLRRKAYWIGKARRIFVERAKLGRRDWVAMFKRLVNDIEAHADDIESRVDRRPPPPAGWDPREPLVWAYCVLQSMPTTWRQDYKNLKEHGTNPSGIEDGIKPLQQQRYRYGLLPTAPALRLRYLATLVRALDDLLTRPETLSVPEGEVDEAWSPAAWRVPDYPCYVVPVDRSHRLVDGKPAERRAMRFHAILPTHIGEYEVELALHPGAIKDGLNGREDCRYGAAVFEALEISTAGDEVGFIVERCHCPRHWEKLWANVDRSRRDGSRVLMWPELAVPADLVERLGARLASEALDRTPKIPVIVAGSWHVEDRAGGGSHANRLVVMDGRGSPIFSYDKRMKFRFKDRPEAIEPGTSLQVLVMEDRLIAVGICLDFCDDCDNHVYPALDVDLVLIPSMGFRNTAGEHMRHARTLQSLHDTHVFVVQQVPVERGDVLPADEPIGFSFVVPAPANAPAPDQREPYRSLAGRY